MELLFLILAGIFLFMAVWAGILTKLGSILYDPSRAKNKERKIVMDYMGNEVTNESK